MTKKLGLFLLSYNRPDYVQKSINSVLQQSYENFDFFISENSPSNTIFNEIQNTLSEQYRDRVKLIKRSPSLPMIEHFNQIYKEAEKYEYFMLFHDDDILKNTALEKMVARLDADSTISAVGCNAYIIDKENVVQKKYNSQLLTDVKIERPKDLISRYVYKKPGHVPFPTYIYRSHYFKGLRLNPNHGGIYSDVSILLELCSRAPLLWVAEPLIEYRIHGENVSSRVYLKQIASLCAFFLKISPSSIVGVSYYFSKQFIKTILPYSVIKLFKK